MNYGRNHLPHWLITLTGICLLLPLIGYSNSLGEYSIFNYSVDKGLSQSTAYSISGNEVISLYEDKSGKLWVGTRNSGLDRFDKDKQLFIHYRFLKHLDRDLGRRRTEPLSS